MTLNDFLKRLRKVEFRIKARSHDNLAGSYRSAFKGSGMLFSECKAYKEGDDVRYIDWNASARQNGVYVKQFIEEREMNVCIILDLSAPMQFGSVGMTKAEKAIEVMSILSFSALKNNDRVGLFMFNEAGMKYIPQTRGRTNAIRLILEAMRFDPEPGENTISGVMAKLMTLMKRRCLVFVISDFLYAGYEQTLRHLSHRHEVIPVVIADPMERAMPDLGIAFIEDIRTHEIMLVDTSSPGFMAEYEVQAQLKECDQKAIFERAKLSCVRVSTVEDSFLPIIHAFERRAGRV